MKSSANVSTPRRRKKAPSRSRPSVQPFGPEQPAAPRYSMQFNLDIGEEVFVDEFAGGGGASEGYHLATGRHVNFAVNHNRRASALHRMNHPHTRHFVQDVWQVDPLEILRLAGGRRIGGCWWSPDCRHHSRASGSALLDRRIRGLPWILLKWIGRGGAKRVAPGKAGRVRRRGPACPRVGLFENVPEVETWGPLVAKRDKATGRVVKRDGTVARKGEHVPYRNQKLVPDKKRAGIYFKRLVRWIGEFGGTWEHRNLRSSALGIPTIRNRLYGICRFDDRPIVWPAQTHNTMISEIARKPGLKPPTSISNCLDFARPCPSIFLSKAEARALRVKRPLKKASLKRLATGVDRFMLKAEKPFLVAITKDSWQRFDLNGDPVGGQVIGPYFVPRYGERPGQAPRTRSVEDAGPSVVPTGNGGDLAAVTLVRTAHGERDRTGKKRGQGAHSVEEPMPTCTGSNDVAVVAASVIKFRGNPATHPPGISMDNPCHTISAGGEHQGVLQATLAATFIAQQNGGVVGHQTYGHSADEPLSTISGKGCQQNIVSATLAVPPLTPELEAKARRVVAFLRAHGVKVDGEFAMVGDYVIVDIGLRMLTPRELFRAQGFPESYIIDRGMDEDEHGRRFEIRLRKSDQVKMVGNSVCPGVAAALIGLNLPEMVIERLAA